MDSFCVGRCVIADYDWRMIIPPLSGFLTGRSSDRECYNQFFFFLKRGVAEAMINNILGLSQMQYSCKKSTAGFMLCLKYICITQATQDDGSKWCGRIAGWSRQGLRRGDFDDLQTNNWSLTWEIVADCGHHFPIWWWPFVFFPGCQVQFRSMGTGALETATGTWRYCHGSTESYSETIFEYVYVRCI